MRGGFFFARPSFVLLVLFFLAAADYASVSSDFKIAVCGFAEAGFAVRVRIEGHRDCCFVRVGAAVVVLAIVLVVLEKHL